MSLAISKTIILMAILLLTTQLAISGPLEDGFAAYKQGDNELAHKIWQPLAIRGDVRAQFFLSVLLENNTESPEDQDDAKKWLTASANNGFIPARFNLGNNFHRGRYGSVNNKMAEYWWNQAAIQGFPEAQYYLATLYYWGKRGVQLNLKEAFYWFEEAAKNGYKDAADAVLLLRAGEPLQPLDSSEPANIAYDDPRIVSKLSLDPKQLASTPTEIDLPKKPETAPAPKLPKKIDTEVKATTPERNDNGWVVQQPASNRTIQLFASTNLHECKDRINKLYGTYRLETHVQTFIKDGRNYCAVIYGSYGRYSEAKAELNKLPGKIRRDKPWIRKLAR